MSVGPRPLPGQRPGSAFDRAVQRSAKTKTSDLRGGLIRAAANRRAVGDDESVRLLAAWLDDLDRLGGVA